MPSFFEQPILNSPYESPRRHWELDAGRPTHRIVESRRETAFVTPIPKPRAARRDQSELSLDEAAAEIDTANQQYQHAHIINGVRRQVAAWRELPERQWKVTPETARLLRHWRHHPFAGIRPFFCALTPCKLDSGTRARIVAKVAAAGENPWRRTRTPSL